MHYIDFLNKVISSTSRSLCQEKDQTKILDPVMCIIKLGILSFKPANTKISIYNHNIYINPPSYIQGIVRNYYGDTKDDLHHLLIPLHAISALYLSTNKGNHSITNIPNFEILFSLAKNGLLILKQTYDNYISIKHSINTCIYVIDNALALIDTNYDNIIPEYSSEDYSRYIWNKAELNAILSLFKLCSEEPDKKKYYISSIESIIIPIETNIALRN